ncbi:MAG TPA: hypothetical protein PK079_25135, partial [Leptospiraceae bacterium]|nr:hypothetical protein [Leptospiraceae bacterium]
MINRFRIKIARRIEKLKEQYDYFRFRYLRSKWNVTILISLLILFVSLFVANNFYAYYMTKNYINIFQVKSTIVSFIRKNLGKAIEIGIADFSSLQGIIFEDIKISQEEDFSNNKLLFTSKRVDVRLTSLFSKAVVPNKIFVYSAKIILDIDDPINTNVLKYIHELNLPDIYFDNLEIQIKSGNQDLLRSVENINVSISRREQFLDITFNDSQFFGLVSGSVKGSGKINLESGENTLRIDFSKHDLDAMEGITNTLINLVPESGYAEGFISLNKTKEDFSLDGNLNFRNFSGDFFTISNIRAKDLTINAKFSYLKEFIDQKTSQSYFKRKISTTEFFYEEQIDTPPNNLKKTTVAIQVNNLDKLFDRLIFEDDFQVKGNMKINMRLEETGKVNDWIWIDGNGSIGNLEIYSKNPEFSLTNTTLKFNWNQNEKMQDTYCQVII